MGVRLLRVIWSMVVEALDHEEAYCDDKEIANRLVCTTEDKKLGHVVRSHN